ncbi:MAG: NDP-sugar synthase [Actinobacteria bacterium]|nr:NDP-sugar synthase [Actinomycetota bacterium]MCG2794544.1 NDP-sugar synthase [Actinomycetes bacterium]MBU4240969.1 NDP-sugar synthase [Actinomycetota bacterium]MBU4301829.1 NDP-sugar synthase [Actinomycetota bacterium]MBU4386105.1 NDP-sugar synthase [Actinomycetota bacterium]
MDEKVMVMAAGLGARLMPLTGEIAKPMVPIVNRPVMEHLLALISGCGFRELAVNLHYFPDAIRDNFGDGSRWGLDIYYSVEERLMGTAGGVKKCADFLGSGTFLVVSGDALTDVDLRELLEFHRERKAIATIVTTPVEDTSKYGVVLAGEDGRVEGFQEKPTEAEAISNVANSGIYVFEPEVLDLIPPDRPYDFGRELFPLLVEAGEALYAWTHRYYWNDVGSIAEYQQGNFDALDGRVKVDIPGNQVAPGIWVGADTTVNRDVIMTPPVCIGDRCVVERGARLLGPVIVGPDTMVRAGAVLYRGIKWGGGYIGRDASMVGSITGSGSRIGEGAVLLDGVVLGSGSVVEDGIVIDPSVRIMSGSVVNNEE